MGSSQAGIGVAGVMACGGAGAAHRLEDTLVVTRLDACAADETCRLVRRPKSTSSIPACSTDCGETSSRPTIAAASFEHVIVNQILTTTRAFGEPARRDRTEAGSKVESNGLT